MKQFCQAGLWLAIGASWLWAQQQRSPLAAFTPPSVTPGAPAGSFPLSGFDTINPGTRGLSFAMTLHTVQGRGEVAVPIVLTTGVQWSVRSTPSCLQAEQGVGCVAWAQNYFPSASWWHENSPMSLRYVPGLARLRQSGDLRYEPTNGFGYRYGDRNGLTNSNLTVVLPDRTEIDFRDSITKGKEHWPQLILNPGFQRGRVFMAVDGSAATFVTDVGVVDQVLLPGGINPINGWLYLKDGTRMRFEGELQYAIDRNGNRTNFSYVSGGRQLASVTSANGHVTSIAYGTLASTGCPFDEIKYPGSNGQNRTVTVNFDLLQNVLHAGSIQTPNQLFPNAPGGISPPTTTWNLSSSTPFNPCLLSEVVLPNGRNYTFKYTPHGLLARVELPTGGAFEYDYDLSVKTVNANPPATYEVRQDVKEKRIYKNRTDSAPESRIQFNEVSPFVTEVKHVGSAGEVLAWTRHHFYERGAGGGLPSYAPSWKNYREYKTEELNAAGAVLRTTEKTWQQRAIDPSFNGEGFGGDDPLSASRMHDPRLTQEEVTWSTGDVSRRTMSYDRYNNVLETKDFGFGVATTGTPLRRSVRTYLQNGYDDALLNPADNTFHVTQHIRDRASSEEIHDASLVSRTEFYYDGATEANATPTGPSAGPAAVQRAAQFDTGWKKRGNLTRVRQLKNGASYVAVSASYDTLGNRTSLTDANLNTTDYTYTDAGTGAGSAFAYVTKVQQPAAGNGTARLEVNYAWNYFLNTLQSVTDANSQPTTYAFEPVSAPGLDRLTQITRPDGGFTQVGYCDTPDASCSLPDVALPGTTLPGNSVATKQSILGTTFQRGYTRYDGLGRVEETRQTGAQTVIKGTIYDGLNRPSQESLPYYAGGSPVYTRTTYDTLGRVTESRNLGDQSYSRTTHTPRDTLVEDPSRTAGRTDGDKRRIERDALGRIVQVTEDVDGQNIVTQYRYDGADRLLRVCQNGVFDAALNCPGGQLRTFTYDGLGRLLTANNPESGLIQHSYDDNGNLLTKSEFDGTVTSLTYDGLNRPKTKTYSGPRTSPAVVFCYDGQVYDTATGQCATATMANAKGKLTSVWSTVSRTEYTGFDVMGRVTGSRQRTSTRDASFAYSYNLAGGLTSTTYPTGRVVTQSYDDLNRLTGAAWNLSGQANRTAAVQSFAAHGAISQLNFGTGPVESWTYSASRLQPQRILLTGGAGTLADLKFAYCAGAAPLTECASNNGNIHRQDVLAGANTITATYGYDGVNRLTSFTEGAGAPQENYGYDRSGNMWRTGRSGMPGVQDLPIGADWYANGKNRAVKPGTVEAEYFGAAGHQIKIGTMGLTYDGEGRVKAATGVVGAPSYEYDGQDRRVRTMVNGAETVFIYDAMGQLAVEYGGVGSGTQVLLGDHLGSTRVVTDGTGAVVARRDYAPYGEELPAVGSRTAALGYGVAAYPRLEFTGHQRDAPALGLDYMQARYYSASTGRFMSPDEFSGGIVDPLTGKAVAPPGPLPYADIDNPQTLNKYGYVRGNPLRYVDPNGHGDVETLLFALKHPRIANLIGSADDLGATNISRNSARFAASVGLPNPASEQNEGTHRNALRHGVWQATIAQKFGTGIAREIGDAHEESPGVNLAMRDFRGENARGRADQTADLLNNQIGRTVGAQSGPQATMRAIAGQVLDHFRDVGMFTSRRNGDGSYTVVQTRLTQAQHDEARRRLANLDQNGRPR